jgi:hypothetical protein
MSEIIRGIPENVPPKATVIDFVAAKEKRREEKSTPTVWFTPNRKPTPENQDGITPGNMRPGEIPPVAKSKGTIIDFQTAREKRLREGGERQESTPFTQTDAIPTPKKEGDQTEDASDPNEEQINAWRIIGSKFAQFDVPTEKREEIFANLADDPKTLSTVAEVVKHFSKPKRDYGAELEEGAAFQKRILDALKNTQEPEQESGKPLTGLQLALLLLLSLFTENIDELFDELEQEDNKEEAA